jgi:voltage-gated potassium channel
MPGIKRKLYLLLQPHPVSNFKEKWIDLALTSLILINVLFLILETIPTLDENLRRAFWNFEVASVGIFTLEYFLRVWTITEDPDYAHPVWGRLKYLITPIAIFDLLAFLPFYLPFFHADLMFMRSARLFRLLRIFKITRYVQAMHVITDVIQEKAEELMISLTLMLFTLVVFSGLMYYVEHHAQPEKFSSIPQTMWWAVATLTTVGYGDMYPITPLGQVLGGMAAITGLGLFAIPTALLASGFSERISKQHRHQKGKYCPHCGKEL